MATFEVRLAEALAAMRAARDPASFTEAEREVVSLARELASTLTQRVMQEVSDDESRKRAALERAREQARGKGIELRVERKRRTEVRTLGGQVVDVVTPYATARPRGEGTRATRGAQGTGVYPVLDELGIVGRSTPALRLLVAQAVCEANSVSAARELLASGGVEVDHKAALRLTYLVSDDALRARAKALKATSVGNDDGEFVGRRVVATVDGGRVCIRHRVAGRPRNGGRKHFKTEWREPKVLTLYVLDDEGKRDRSVNSVIDGTMGDADAVFDLLRYHLLRMGAHRATEVILAGDGAKWIWNRAESLREALGLERAQFTEVVDYFHVVERLNDAAKSQTRWSEEKRAAWAEERKSELMKDEVEATEAAVLRLFKRGTDARKTELAYWQRNRERLRYGTFRAAKKAIGSGAVESSVRRVVNLRLKGASIVWTEPHAEGVLHLRAYAKSGRWMEIERAVLGETGWRPTARRIPRAA